jgi:hypothetical protein
VTRCESSKCRKPYAAALETISQSSATFWKSILEVLVTGVACLVGRVSYFVALLAGDASDEELDSVVGGGWSHLEDEVGVCLVKEGGYGALCVGSVRE